MSGETDSREYIARLVLKRDLHQLSAEKHLAMKGRIDQELNEIGQRQGFVDAEKKEVPTEHKEPAVKEETFVCLKFEAQQGARLGEYGVAHKNANLPDKFSPAYGILRANNATIKSRYHGPNYVYGFWLFGEKGDRIYRQKIKKS